MMHKHTVCIITNTIYIYTIWNSNQLVKKVQKMALR